MQKEKILSYLFLALAFFQIGCAGKTGCKDPLALNFDPEAEVPNGTCIYPELYLDLSYTMGNLPFETNRIYTIDSNIIAIQTLQFYLSNIELTREDQSQLSFENVYILGNGTTSNNQKIGEIGKEPYQKISCFLGVDETTNAQINNNFSNKPSNHPLNIQNPAMHWTNPNKEYIFLKIKGKVDINGDGIPSDNEGFYYEIGTNALLQSLEFPLNKKYEETQNNIVLEIDVQELIKGVNIKTQRFTKSTDDFALASKIANNVQQALSLK